jgi:hypothetical protein
MMSVTIKCRNTDRHAVCDIAGCTYAECPRAGCYYAKCPCVGCPHAKCLYTECRCTICFCYSTARSNTVSH